jgi:hypothetical protein
VRRSNDSRGWRRGLLTGKWLTTAACSRAEGMPERLLARGHRCRLMGVIARN